MKFLILEEVDSTNSYVSLHERELEDMTMVAAASQTAGRGQRGNSWESEPGRNLTFTLLARRLPVDAIDQFAVSEAVALAIADFLQASGIEATVKWPNDIYAGDKKISGILIEHTVMGKGLENTRIGVGLNVNQLEFRSDAPNPVSMAQLTGEEYDISRVAASAGMHLEKRLRLLGDPAERVRMHEEFKSRLWRREGAYPFRRKDTGRLFSGRIADVSPQGPITIEDTETGARSDFAFKEVEYVL